MPVTSSPHKDSRRILIGPVEHSFPLNTKSLASGIATWWWNSSHSSNSKTRNAATAHPNDRDTETDPNAPLSPLTPVDPNSTQQTLAPLSTPIMEDGHSANQPGKRHKAHSISEPAAKNKSSLTLPKKNLFERKVPDDNQDNLGESEDDYLLSPISRNQSHGVDESVPSFADLGGPSHSKLYPYSILSSQPKSRYTPTTQSVIEPPSKHVVIQNFRDYSSASSHEERDTDESDAGSSSPLISPESASGFVTASDTLHGTSPTFVTAYEKFPDSIALDDPHTRTSNTHRAVPGSLNMDATGPNFVELIADDLSPKHRTLQAQAEAHRLQCKPTDAQKKFGIADPASIPSPITSQYRETNSLRSDASRYVACAGKAVFPGKRGILLVRIEGTEEGGNKLYDERTPRKRLGISVGWREYYCILRKGGSLEFRTSLNNIEFEVPLDRYTQLSVYSPLDYTLALTVPSPRPGLQIVHVIRAQTLPATTAWYRCIRHRLRLSRPNPSHAVTAMLFPGSPSRPANLTANTNRASSKGGTTCPHRQATAYDATQQSPSDVPTNTPNAPAFASVSSSADDAASSRAKSDSHSSNDSDTPTNTTNGYNAPSFDTSDGEPKIIDVYAPDVELRVRVPIEHDLLTVWDVRDRALSAMKNVAAEELKSVVKLGEFRGGNITWGVCWRRKERLEWVDESLRAWWDRRPVDCEPDTPVMRGGDGTAVAQMSGQLAAEKMERIDLAKMPQLLENTHRLELRPITHDDYYVKDPDTGERFDEPRPIGGYMVRLRSATRLGHLTGVRKFFYSQGHLLLYCRPSPTNLVPAAEKTRFEFSGTDGAKLRRSEDRSESPESRGEEQTPHNQDAAHVIAADDGIVTTTELEILPADAPTASDPSPPSPKRSKKSKLKSQLGSSSTLIPTDGISSNPASPTSPLDGLKSLAQFGEEDDRAETERQLLTADGALDLAMIAGVDIIGTVGMLYGRRSQDNRASNLGEGVEETDGEETLLKVKGKDGAELILSVYSKSAATAWAHHLQLLSKYWRLRMEKESRLRYFVAKANTDDRYGKSWAEFTDPGWGYASPKLWSYCLVGGCHPPIVKTGPLYYRTGRRGIFQEALFVLTSRHLLFFGPTKRTDQTLQGIISLAPCYVTAGLGHLEANGRNDRGNFPVMCDASEGGLPRIFEDGTVALDDDETCMFAIWRPKSLTSSAASISSATISTGNGRFASWANHSNRWKSAKQEEQAIREEEERKARERLAEERGEETESPSRNKMCGLARCGGCRRRWGRSWRFGRRGVNILLQARTKYEAREWIRAIEVMIERSANVPVA